MATFADMVKVHCGKYLNAIFPGNAAGIAKWITFNRSPGCVKPAVRKVLDGKMGVAFGFTLEVLPEGEDNELQTLSENEKKTALDVLHLNLENAPKKLSVSAELKLHMDLARWWEENLVEWKKSGFATDSDGFMRWCASMG